MQSNNFAPIVLFVYNRLWHTQQTIKALQNNELALESELFIYADGAKNEQSYNQVLEVRNYIREVDGFKKVLPSTKLLYSLGTFRSSTLYLKPVVKPQFWLSSKSN